jgi:hypothetical protein
MLIEPNAMTPFGRVITVTPNGVVIVATPEGPRAYLASAVRGSGRQAHAQAFNAATQELEVQTIARRLLRKPQSPPKHIRLIAA